MTILSKKEMSEEDIKLQYITPAILAKWDKSRITMETRITDGKICLNGNVVYRDKKSAKFADYVLYWNSSFPIVIVEPARTPYEQFKTAKCRSCCHLHKPVPLS